MAFSDEQILARLEEAKRMVRDAPPVDPARMTLLDTVIAFARMGDTLEAQRRNLDELSRMGVLTQGDVRLYNQQAITVYRLAVRIHATILRRAADVVPFVEPSDLVRFLPLPPPPVLLPGRPTLRRGVGDPFTIVIGGVTIGWGVLVIAALLVFGLVIGSVYVLTSKAVEIKKYDLDIRSTERMQRERIAAIERCRASGGTMEACTRLAEAAAPPPPPTPPKSDLDKTMEKIGTYLTWGLIGVAGITLLPVVVGVVQSLRGLGGSAKKPRGGFTITPTDDDYE